MILGLDYLQLTALICIFSLWLAEAIMRRGSALELKTTQFENKTTILIVLVTMGGVNLALIFPLFDISPPTAPSLNASWFLLIILVMSIVLRYWAMATLGEMFTRTLRIISDHRIVEHGPYRWLRHPGYLANILAYWSAAILISQSVLFGSALGGAVYLTYLFRIHYEEKMLISLFGKSYCDYQKQTRKLIPWVY